MQYRRKYVTRLEKSEAYDTVVAYEITQLEKMWRKADLENLLTPEKMSDAEQLELARARLDQVEQEIQNSEKRIEGSTRKKREFFKKAHGYYHHSASALIEIIEFLLSKKDQYSVQGNEISFDSEADAETIERLIEKLSFLDAEKQELDAFILEHNREIEKKLAVQGVRSHKVTKMEDP